MRGGGLGKPLLLLKSYIQSGEFYIRRTLSEGTRKLKNIQECGSNSENFFQMEDSTRRAIIRNEPSNKLVNTGCTGQKRYKMHLFLNLYSGFIPETLNIFQNNGN